jgi:VIT1/CCC1 family predicted Fe2+/Mn2+ transporter
VTQRPVPDATHPGHLTHVHHAERHRSGRTAWLRAAVLGANDGLLSTASIVIGVAAASTARSGLLIAGFAALAAGAFSMAVGEYTSVSSQRDTELADLDRERRELLSSPEAERAELAGIYRSRGLTVETARRVAEELMAADPLAAHARDELGLDPAALARPVQAALVSALSFTLGALVPVLVVALVSAGARVTVVVVLTLVGLAILGSIGARLGGAPRLHAALRLVIFGGLAMVVTSLIGHLVGSAVG